MQNCPKCNTKTDVYDSRLNGDGLLRRKRECPSCSYRFATIEVLDTVTPLMAREPKPKVPKPETPPKPKKPVAAKVVKEKRKVRKFDDSDDYIFGSAFEEELFDVGKELGIFK